MWRPDDAELIIDKLIKIPNDKFPENGIITIVAFAGGVNANDDFPTVEYSVKIYFNVDLVKTIILNKEGDGGMVSSLAINRRSNHVQMIINIAEYIAQGIEIDVP